MRLRYATQARRHVLLARVDKKDRQEDEASPSEYGAVLGVDLNVDGYLSVTSTGAFLGNADYLNHKRAEYERRRGKLHQTGTRSAHLTLSSIGDRFSNWSEDYLHRVALALVLEARRHDCDAIAFEKLKHMREHVSNASKFQQWAFNKLQSLVEYKAEEYGILVDDVNYPTLLALLRSLRVGLPASKTRFAGTGIVPVGSAVSTGVPSK